jgi:hypothetical protein
MPPEDNKSQVGQDLQHIIPLGEPSNEPSDSLVEAIFKIKLQDGINVNLGPEALTGFERLINNLFGVSDDDYSIAAKLKNLNEENLPSAALKDSEGKLSSKADAKNHIRSFYVNPKGEVVVRVSSEFKAIYDKASPEQKLRLQDYLRNVGEKEAVNPEELSVFEKALSLVKVTPVQGPSEKLAKVENNLSDLKDKKNEVIDKIIASIKSNVRKKDAHKDAQKDIKDMLYLPSDKDLKELIVQNSTIIKDIDALIKDKTDEVSSLGVNLQDAYAQKTKHNLVSAYELSEEQSQDLNLLSEERLRDLKRSSEGLRDLRGVEDGSSIDGYKDQISKVKSGLDALEGLIKKQDSYYKKLIENKNKINKDINEGSDKEGDKKVDIMAKVDELIKEKQQKDQRAQEEKKQKLVEEVKNLRGVTYTDSGNQASPPHNTDSQKKQREPGL